MKTYFLKSRDISEPRVAICASLSVTYSDYLGNQFLLRAVSRQLGTIGQIVVKGDLYSLVVSWLDISRSTSKLYDARRKLSTEIV